MFSTPSQLILLEGVSLSDLLLHNMVSECAERKDFTYVRW